VDTIIIITCIFGALFAIFDMIVDYTYNQKQQQENNDYWLKAPLKRRDKPKKSEQIWKEDEDDLDK